MKKRKLLLAAIALLLVFGIGSTIAYLTDTQSQTNVFTMGKVDITLSEGNWNENNAKGMVPGQTVVKEPTITNVGESKAYVFIEVKEPCVNGKKVFDYTLNTGWVPKDGTAAACAANSDSDITTVYAYGSASEMTVTQKNDVTAKLFDNVTLNTTLNTADLDELSARDTTNHRVNVVVTGYGIQSESLGAISPTDVWAKYTSN